MVASTRFIFLGQTETEQDRIDSAVLVIVVHDHCVLLTGEDDMRPAIVYAAIPFLLFHRMLLEDRDCRFEVIYPCFDRFRGDWSFTLVATCSDDDDQNDEYTNQESRTDSNIVG